MSGSEAATALARLDALAACTDEPGRITRLAFSPALSAANALVLGWMRQADMAARVDAVGNVFGRYEGAEPGAPAILLGSHLDTVRDGGRFDGPLGVVAGVAVAERLRRQSRRLPFAVEVIGFADEEGVRFGGTVLGSRAVAGQPPADWREMRDENGVSAEQALRAFSLDPEGIDGANRRQSPPIAYLELHIEQGPQLEAADTPLGCVTAIAGATRLAVTLGGAAGATPASADALAAAAECVLAVERLCAREAAVGTVGRLRIHPNAGGVRAALAEFTVDLRAADDSQRRRLLGVLSFEFETLAQRRGLALQMQTLSESNATPCAAHLIAAALDVLAGMGLPPMRLPSGAGHDGIAISAIAPIGMLFVRCAGGVSHNPAERVSDDDVTAGIEALYRLCLAASRAAEGRRGT